MSYNGNGLGGRHSTGSMNTGGGGCPTPFMFGGSYGFSGGSGGSSASATSFGNQCNYASVRDCMRWPTSLPADNGQRNVNTYGSNKAHMYYGYGSYGNGQQTSQPVAANPAANNVSVSYPQPKAFIQVPGMGGGEAKYQQMQIPCHLGPSGAQPSFGTPEPITIKVRAPEGAGQNGEPIKFQIDPSQYMGMASVKTIPGRR